MVFLKSTVREYLIVIGTGRVFKTGFGIRRGFLCQLRAPRVRAACASQRSWVRIPLSHLNFSGSWDNCLNCPASAKIISSFDFKHRTSYNIYFIRITEQPILLTKRKINCLGSKYLPKNGQSNLVLVLVLESKGPYYSSRRKDGWTILWDALSVWDGFGHRHSFRLFSSSRICITCLDELSALFRRGRRT